MKCFNHENEEALGICKSCGRGLCRDCITEVDLSCSCKNRCEAIVATLNDLVERGRTSYQKTGSIQMRNGMLIVLMGILFVVLGIYSGYGGIFYYFLVGAGSLFALMGLSSIYFAIRYTQKK